MPTLQARPRYWIAGYDTAHLAVPALLGLIGVLLGTAPSPTGGRTRVPTPDLPQSTQGPLILSPTSMAILTAAELKIVEGLGPPGADVRLIWYDRPFGPSTRIGSDGRWSFAVGSFPEGRHALRAVIRWQGSLATSPPAIITIRPEYGAPGSGQKRQR